MNHSIQTIHELLTYAHTLKASDLHLTVGIPPVFRIDGQLVQHDHADLTAEMVDDMIKELLPSNKAEQYRQQGETDFNFALQGVCRFRVNAYRQQNAGALAVRLIPIEVPSIESLNMPSVLLELANKPQGLILVTGPTGSGKSTTLAAMIDYINTTMSRHIITLEDPIEYLHTSKKSVVNQREIGVDTVSFASGLRAALRQDPDIVLVGEMRDLETISTAITAAETGHLVFGTLHTSSAPTSIDRMIDIFPPHQQAQIRTQLASVLLGIISQRLFVRKNKQGRVAATEILIATPAVSNLIRSEKVYQIPSVIQTSRALGMHTLETSLHGLVASDQVSLEDAIRYKKEVTKDERL